MTKKEALEKAGYKPKRGRPRIGGPEMKTRLFNIRVTAAMHAQLKGVPPDLIREILGRAILRHANDIAYRDGQDGGQGLEPQYTAPAAPQGGQVDESAAGQDKVAQPDQAVDPGGTPAAQAAPPDLKTGWAAGAARCPDTESLFME